MIYSFFNAQGIKLGCVGWDFMPPSKTLTLSSVAEATATTPEVSQYTIVTTTLSVEDRPHLSPTPTKRGQDEYQHYY